ncbi:hypothetical protein V6N13_027670 [Hibiscus sabdariffa]
MLLLHYMQARLCLTKIMMAVTELKSFVSGSSLNCIVLSNGVAGNTKFARSLQSYLMSRDHTCLKMEFGHGHGHGHGHGKMKVECIENQGAVEVTLGLHVFLTVGDYYSSDNKGCL